MQTSHCSSTSPRPRHHQQNQQQHKQHHSRLLSSQVLQKAVRTSTPAMAASSPLFTFGVISDVQYADIPDGQSFHGVPRFYRNSLVATQRAVIEGWAPAGVQFGIHFGDILDGFQPKDKSAEMLQRVVAAFDALGDGRRTYHMLGNHCLYNLPRPALNEALQIPPAADGASYYSFSPHPAWRFVVLDAYDVSLLGWPDDHPRHLQAQEILDRENPNQVKNSPEGLVGVQRRFVMFGGGVSEQQLEWLEQELQDADQQGQCVVICCHLPILPDTCPPACLVWNYEDVLSVLHKHPGLVVASIAGHTHQNGYLVDQAGIHHMVLPGVVETPPGRDCYGVVQVYEDRLVLQGTDVCMSCTCRLPAAAVERQRRAAALQQVAAAAAAAVPGQGPGGKGDRSDSDIVVDVSDGAAAGKLAEAVAGIQLEAVAAGSQ